MATTEEHLARSDELERVREAAAAERLPTADELERLWASPAVRRPRFTRPMSYRSWNHLLLAAWLFVFGSVRLIQPQPATDVVVPVWASLLLTVFTAGLFGTVYGLASAQPWALRLSIVTAVLGIALGAACGATDHHRGLWWGYEMVAFTGLAALSGHALRSARR